MIWSIFQIVPSHLCLILRKKASFESFVNRWCTCFTSLHWRIFQSPHLRGVHPDKQNDANVRAPKISKKKSFEGFGKVNLWISLDFFLPFYRCLHISTDRLPSGFRVTLRHQMPSVLRLQGSKVPKKLWRQCWHRSFFSREGWFFPGFGWWKKSTINFWMSEIVWKFHIFLSREDLESCKEVRILVNLAEKRTSGNCFFDFFCFTNCQANHKSEFSKIEKIFSSINFRDDTPRFTKS